MTYIELMTWLILAIEIACVLLVALVALALWTWRANSQISGTVDQIVGQMERVQKVRGSELASRLGEDCPSEALQQAVELCLQHERALLMAVAESLRHRGAMGPERVPSAVQALTEAAIGAGQASVPPEDPNPELIADNEKLRSASEQLANELAGTREAFETLDREYRRAFEGQREGLEKPAATPAAPAPQAPPAPQVMRAVPQAAGPEEDALPPPDMDFDGLAADLEALSDGIAPLPPEADPVPSIPADGASSIVEAGPEIEVIRVDDDDGVPTETVAPRAARG